MAFKSSAHCRPASGTLSCPVPTAPSRARQSVLIRRALSGSGRQASDKRERPIFCKGSVHPPLTTHLNLYIELRQALEHATLFHGKHNLRLPVGASVAVRLRVSGFPDPQVHIIARDATDVVLLELLRAYTECVTYKASLILKSR